MNSQTLLFLSLGIAGGSLVIGLLSLYLTLKSEKVRKTFYAGDEPVSLEKILSAHAAKLDSLSAEHASQLEELQRLAFNSNFSVQKIGMVRFNTFGDSGGNLSFSLAILDADNSGLILTSMFGREQNRIYAKPVQKGTSEFTLTEEEITAIEKAVRDWKEKTVPPLKVNKNKRRAKQ